MMALISNWDLKHENNAVHVYEEKHGDSGAPELHYAVSDLGPGFGTAGRSLTRSMSKGNLKTCSALSSFARRHRSRSIARGYRAHR
jgi:hypothetical protein